MDRFPNRKNNRGFFLALFLISLISPLFPISPMWGQEEPEGVKIGGKLIKFGLKSEEVVRELGSIGVEAEHLLINDMPDFSLGIVNRGADFGIATETYKTELWFFKNHFYLYYIFFPPEKFDGILDGLYRKMGWPTRTLLKDLKRQGSEKLDQKIVWWRKKLTFTMIFKRNLNDETTGLLRILHLKKEDLVQKTTPVPTPPATPSQAPF